MGRKGKVTVFITPEIAIDDNLPFSGGLGTFSQSMSHAGHKKGLPFVTFATLPREGFDQGLNERGMITEYNRRSYEGTLEDTGIKLELSLWRKPLVVRVYRLPAGTYDLSEGFFFDADIEENDYPARFNTIQLYGGSCHSGSNIFRKITQTILLGKATNALIKHLHLDVRMYHMNESHVIFTAVDFLNALVASGRSFAEALRETRTVFRFTTHTSIDTGNPRYSYESVSQIGGYSIDMLRALGGEKENFFTTAAGSFLSGRSNAVSKRHLEEAKKMLNKYTDKSHPLIAITNGQNQDFWQPSEFKHVSNALELLMVKQDFRRKFRSYLRERNIHINDETMVIVWARRFVEYKRPKLICYDMEWMKQKLYHNRFALLFAGKPHPDDLPMQDVWNDIYRMSRELPNLHILSGFNLEMNKLLKAGADVWLNTPRAPQESCGTSGMGARMCGTRQASTPDGWVLEAKEHEFVFGSRGIQDGDQDWFDASEMRTCFCSRMIPQFYFDKKLWYQNAFQEKKESEQQFTDTRMLDDYIAHLYSN